MQEKQKDDDDDEPWQKTAGLGSSIDLNDIKQDLNIIADDIKQDLNIIADDITTNTDGDTDIIWDKWEIEDQDATLTSEQINRMNTQKLNWNNEDLELIRLVFIHGFSEKCEKIDIILKQIYERLDIEKKDDNDCCNFDDTLEDISSVLIDRRNHLISNLQELKTSDETVFHVIKEIFKTYITGLTTAEAKKIFEGDAQGTSVISQAQENPRCCENNKTDSCGACYITARDIAKQRTHYFSVKETACISKNYSGKYKRKDKPRYGLCHSRPNMINQDDIIEDETVINKLLKNNSNAPSAAKAPAAKSHATKSAAALASAAARLSQSSIGEETKIKINILIEYLRFLCKTLTHHRKKIAGITDKQEFTKKTNKKNKVKLYSYLIRSLDDLNKIIIDIGNCDPPDMDISTIISSGGGTRKKQKYKITMQKSRKATRKKASRKKVTHKKATRKKTHRKKKTHKKATRKKPTRRKR